MTYVDIPLLFKLAEGIKDADQVTQREGIIPLRRPGERVEHVTVVTVVTTVRRDMPLDAQVQFGGHLSSPLKVRLVEDPELII
jgi:hypothetical protein